MPAREMLADMLAELKRPSEALAEYQGALKNSPNRFDSLYGVAHAAQMAGDSAAANGYYTKLMEISAPAADRAELAEAKSYLATASQSKCRDSRRIYGHQAMPRPQAVGSSGA